MKKYILFFVLLLPCLAGMSQSNHPPTPEYEYAMLRIYAKDENRLYLIDRNNPSYIVQYSNTGEEVRLKDTLKIDREKENFTAARFKCFQYLNHQGYELVTSSCYLNNPRVSGTEKKYEYIFKRPKQVSSK